MQKFMKNKSAHLLVELIIYISILSLILTGLYYNTNYCLKSFISFTCYLDSKIQLDYALEYISNEVRRADIIIDGNRLVSLFKRYKNNLGFLIGIRENLDINCQSYKYIFYCLENGNLVRYAASGTKNYIPNNRNFIGNFMVENVKKIDSNIYKEGKRIRIKIESPYLSREEIVDIKCVFKQ